MNAEILGVGTELLLGDIANTNARFISRELAQLGINVYRHTVVGDNHARLRAAYAEAFERTHLVITTGGLGPTEDDITKEAAADYFDKPLVLHEESWLSIQRYFENAGLRMTANNRKQAMLPEGCRIFPNHNGTAPGVCVEQDGKILIMLPGPPHELEPMFTEQAVPFLRSKSNGVFISRMLKITGIGESQLETQLQDLMDAQTNPTIALYAKDSEVSLRLTASAADEIKARALIDPVAAMIYEQLSVNIYGEDDDTLERVITARLKAKGLTLACAESCTGGMVAARLVSCPGVSDVLMEGLVTYSNASKTRRLGVSEALLGQYGAVSAQTAAAMAEGAAKTAGTAIGLSTTGIAGPDGGTPEKPVGLVYLGLYIDGEGVKTKELRLSGNRGKIRMRATVNALDFLRRAI